MTPEQFRARLDTLAAEMARAVVGYREAVDDLLLGVFAGGNILLEAAPGLGASPRGIQALILGGKMRALCSGRAQVAAEDIRSVAAPALGHRLLLNFEGLADRIQPDAIVQELLDQVPEEGGP